MKETDNNILEFDEFLRSIKQNMDTPCSILLGAGASIESGILSATDCIWEWKHQIFLSKNPSLAHTFNNIKIDNVQNAVQNWLNNEKIYPALGDKDEYSFYAKNALPIEEDRRKYFQSLVINKNPSIGYHLLAMLAETGFIKSVWTTNFDGLMIKTAHQYKLTPIEVTLESKDRIYRSDVKNEISCISLHGDYKYGPLKNTTTELDAQNEILIDALGYELQKRNLIVIGYSGRDDSLMSALYEIYKKPGSGRLYWCGYGANCSDSVEKLISIANNNKRIAYYISTDGFDKTILSLSKHCMNENAEFISNIEKLKNSYTNTNGFEFTSFSLIKGSLKKIVKTNIYPFSFPGTCYKFKAKYTKDENSWDYTKSLAIKNIMAIPYEEDIFCWASKKNLILCCNDHIENEILTIPFTRENLFHIGNFRELLLNTVSAILGQRINMDYLKDRIWDTHQMFSFKVDDKTIEAYHGVKLSLIFDFKYSYISITPTYKFKSDEKYSKAERKIFADAFAIRTNQQKPNLNIHNYIESWVKKLLGDNKFISAYPINDDDGFRFVFGTNSALVGINNYFKGNTLQLPSQISINRIALNGIECHDPELQFYNSITNSMATDFHPMRGLIKNSPFDFTLNDKVLRSSINIGVICPKSHDIIFYSFLNQLNNRQDVNYNIDYVLPFLGFYNTFKVSLNIPVSGSLDWKNINAPNNPDINAAAIEFGQMIIRLLEKIDNPRMDVVLIYIPKEYESFTSFDTESEKFDLHNFVKAFAIQKGIATQFVREKTIDSDMRCQIMWSLSLAIYVKSCRIPWVISGLRNETAFVGIGYSLNKTANGTNIILGCSHIYSSDGQGLKYKLTKLNDVSFDKRKNPYLSEDEAYKLGFTIKDLFYKSFRELPKRVVIHKRTPFKQNEIKGIVKSLSAAGIKDIDLLEINFEENLKCFEYSRDNISIDGFPVRRGLCFPVNPKTIYLYTHGIAPSIRNPSYRYIQGGKTIPQPIKIVKHYGNGDLNSIASEILGLSRMNWNSFELYSKLPCTIESSNIIAKIGPLLSNYEGAIYDYRFFM